MFYLKALSTSKQFIGKTAAGSNKIEQQIEKLHK